MTINQYSIKIVFKNTFFCEIRCKLLTLFNKLNKKVSSLVGALPFNEPDNELTLRFI
jgi:hypothetical protein